MLKYALAVLVAVALSYVATQQLGIWPDAWSQYLIAGTAALAVAWLADRPNRGLLVAAGVMLVAGYGAHVADVGPFAGIGFLGIGTLSALIILIFLGRRRDVRHGHG